MSVLASSSRPNLLSPGACGRRVAGGGAGGGRTGGPGRRGGDLYRIVT